MRVNTRGKSDRKISGFGLLGFELDRASGRVGYYPSMLHRDYPSMLHRVSGFSFRASGFYKYTYFAKNKSISREDLHILTFLRKYYKNVVR